MGFWQDKRVVVTGGAGFLGSFVVEELARRGCPAPIVPLHQDYDLTQGDAVRRLYRDTRPEVVIHLAAVVGGIGANRERPGEFFYDNLMMGVQLIEEARKAKVAKFVSIGTVCSYPKFTPVPFQESSLWDGYPEETNAPYGLAKKMLLVQSQAYRQQYGFNGIFLLPVNLYGPRENFDLQSSHVIPALIRKVIEAKEQGRAEIEVWGDGSPTREFLFARDAAEGIVLATEKYDGADPVNLGSGEEFAIRDLVRTICEVCGYSGTVRYDTSKPNGQPRRKLDTRRAEQLFGFKARTPFRQGLDETVRWFLAHRSEIE